MNVVLNRFGYRFAVNGMDGGLESFSVKFAPAGTEDGATVRAAFQVVADRYVEVLDRLLEEDFVKGERCPKMSDAWGSIVAGYRYTASWRKGRRLWPRRDLSARLSEVFEVPEPDMRGGHERHRTYWASVELSVPRMSDTWCDAAVSVDVNFDHKVNAGLYRVTQALPGVEVSDGAADEMLLLDRALALDWDRPGRDYYQSFFAVSPEASLAGDGA